MLKTVTKNLSLYLIAPAITGVLGFIILPIKSQYLSTTDYGIIGLIDSLTVFMGILLTLQFNSGVVRLYYDFDSESEKKKYLSSIFIFLLALALFITPIAGVLFYFFTDTIFNDRALTFYPYIFFQLITLFVMQFYKMTSLVFYVKQKVKFQGLLSLLIFLFTNGIMLYLIIELKLGAKGFVYATLLTHIILIPYYLFFIIKNVKPAFNIKHIKDTFIYSVPFIPTTLGTVIYTYADRYIIQNMLDMGSTGIYTFAQTLIIPYGMLISALNYVFFPNYFKLRKENKDIEQIKRTERFLGVVLGLLIIGWIYFVNEISMFFNADYLPSFKLLPFLGTFKFLELIYIFPLAVLLFHKKTKYVPLITLIPAFANVGLNILLIPILGLYGAVITTVICGATTLFLTHIFAHKVEKGQFEYHYVFILVIMVGIFGYAGNLIHFHIVINLLIKAALVLAFLGLNMLLLRLSLKKITRDVILFFNSKENENKEENTKADDN